jgi:hypothetical protein
MILIGYGGIILGIFFCVFCPFWIARASDRKDRFYGVFSLIGACVILFCGILIVSYENDILFFAPKKEAINTQIDIDPEIVEASSVLYLFNDAINYQTTSIDIVNLLGNPYKEHVYTGSYIMNYRSGSSQYTLNKRSATGITAHFNKSGEKGKIRSIAWQYEVRDTAMYYELLDYLTLILGEPMKQTGYFDDDILTADWAGYHLECNDYRVSLDREFN